MRANYSFALKDMQGRNVMSIIDHYTDTSPTKTVTNDIENIIADIENIIADIEKKTQLKAKDCLVVYCDSDGDWVYYDPGTDTFWFTADSEEEVVRLAIKKQLELI
jgi:hypothetical protein